MLIFQPRERGRMRFHAIQNVETALRFLRLDSSILYLHHLFVLQVQGDQAGQHQRGGHRGRQPQAHPRPHLDNHPPLPGRRQSLPDLLLSNLLSFPQVHILNTRDWVPSLLKRSIKRRDN